VLKDLIKQKSHVLCFAEATADFALTDAIIIHAEGKKVFIVHQD